MATITYEPRGTWGCTCHLRSARGNLLTLQRPNDAEADAEVNGDASLEQNQTLVGGLEAYAQNELARRRSRDLERKKLHAKSVDQARRLVLGLVDLMDDAGPAGSTGFCSGCLQKSAHARIQRRMKPAAFLCTECGAATTRCAVPGCQHMARRSSGAVEPARFCAEHRHEIPSFDRLDARLESIDDYRRWLQFESRNAKRIVTVTVGAVSGAAILGPAMLAAAPAIGGTIGAMSGLSGAAATSHGLAILGGGAISAGGLGMAGGAAVLTATGTGLGGRLGASVTSAYVSADESFAIELVKKGGGPPVLFSSGFLTAGEENWPQWRELITTRYPDRSVYRVRWGSKELKNLWALMLRGTSGNLGMRGASMVAKRATKSAARRFGTLGAIVSSSELLMNPWTVARARADMTAAVLADLIARTETDRFVLIGHSLGARVMAETACALATKDGGPRVEDVHLLGAAIDHKLDLRPLEQSVQGTVTNYWSRNDAVLKRAYRSAQLGERAAGAEGFLHESPVVRNRNVSRVIAGHSDYAAKAKLL